MSIDKRHESEIIASFVVISCCFGGVSENLTILYVYRIYELVDVCDKWHGGAINFLRLAGVQERRVNFKNGERFFVGGEQALVLLRGEDQRIAITAVQHHR